MIVDSHPYGNAFYLKVARDYDTPWEIDHYYYTLTGETQQKGFYSDRNWGLMAKVWWLNYSNGCVVK